MITRKPPRPLSLAAVYPSYRRPPFVNGVGGDPKWSIAPLLADDSLIQYQDITVSSDDGETLTGGAGSDLLFGGDGADMMFGENGDAYLFGGRGADILNGGPGNDFLKGNGGMNTFQFARSGDGRDIIAEFEPALDHLEIRGLTDADAQLLIAKSTANPNGSAVLHLTPDDDITLLGISIGELQTSFFLLR